MKKTFAVAIYGAFTTKAFQMTEFQLKHVDPDFAKYYRELAEITPIEPRFYQEPLNNALPKCKSFLTKGNIENIQIKFKEKDTWTYISELSESDREKVLKTIAGDYAIVLAEKGTAGPYQRITQLTYMTHQHGKLDGGTAEEWSACGRPA